MTSQSMVSLEKQSDTIEKFIDSAIEDLQIFSKLFKKYNALRHNGEDTTDKLKLYVSEINDCKKAIYDLENQLQNIYMYMGAESDCINDAEQSYKDVMIELYGNN